jgi:hypothetical protein
MTDSHARQKSNRPHKDRRQIARKKAQKSQKRGKQNTESMGFDLFSFVLVAANLSVAF